MGWEFVSAFEPVVLAIERHSFRFGIGGLVGCSLGVVGWSASCALFSVGEPCAASSAGEEGAGRLKSTEDFDYYTETVPSRPYC